MNSTQVPEEMILVDNYAKEKGLDRVEVINQIRDEKLDGSFINDDWYIFAPELKSQSISSSSTPKNNPQFQSPRNTRSEYGVARGICILFAILGWVSFVLGIMIVIVGVAIDNYFELITFAITGIGISMSGLFLVAAGQLLKATTDNADSTREILKIMRSTVLEIQK